MSCTIAIVGSDLSSRLLCLSLVLGGWRGGKIIYVKNSFPASSPAGGVNDNRYLALSISSVNYLRRLGVWDLLRIDACPILSMRLYGGDISRYGNLLSFAKPLACDALAYTVKLSSLHASIESVFSSHCGDISFLEGKITRRSDRYMIGKSHADLLIITGNKTDNLDSSITLPRYLYDSGFCGDTAISAKVTISSSHQNTARQIFLPDGPVAFLPICTTDKDCHQVSMIWSFRSKHPAKNYSLLSGADFVAALNSNISISDYEFIDCGKLDIFPLRRYFRRYCSGSNMAFLGSGGHSLHPLAGQNFNLTIGDIICLSENLQRCCDVGAFSSMGVFLEDYTRVRQVEFLSFLALTEFLHAGFSHKNDYIRGLYRFGLGFMDGIDFAKDFFIRRASY